MEFKLLHRARGATANEGSSTAHEGSSLMAGGGAVLCIFWYQVGVKYHPTPLGAVKKMMRSNAESLMAGAGAVYLYFDTESMQNIIQALYIPNHERQVDVFQTFSRSFPNSSNSYCI